MRTKAIRKKIVSFALALTLVAVFCMSALAENITVEGLSPVTTNDYVNASVTATTVSVTHPMDVSYTIDPNTGTVTIPDITIKNNSVAAITVTLTSFQAAKKCVTDVLPGDKDWASLNNADSLKYVSLGLTAKAGGWATGYNTATYYSANATSALIGTLASGSTGALTLSANYGKSFKTTFTFTHMLCFQFDLA